MSTTITPGKKTRRVHDLPPTPHDPRNEAPNQTQYADKPVTGGEEKLVINELQIRQVVRTSSDILSWRAALNAAESRYFPNRTWLYNLYEDVILDGHLSGIIQKRLDSVLNKPILFKNASGNEVPAMNRLITSWQFRKVLQYIMETIFWGVTGIEFIPGRELQVRLIPRKHIKTKTQLISFEENVQDEGIDYTRLDNVWIIGEQEDLGLLNKCVPYVLYKRGLFADWAQFIEIFGQPVRIARYDVFDTTTRDALLETLEKAGSSLALLLPKSADFEMMDGKTANANGELQYTFKESCNQEMSIIVLGNTETTSGANGTGSQAKAKTHLEEQQQITKNDIAFLSAMLNDPHFLRVLASYGFPVAGGYFEVSRDIDIDFLNVRKDIDLALRSAGLPIDPAYFYETYSIPRPGPQTPGSHHTSNTPL
jgi:Protein of unknown function (DUF935)